MWCIYRGKMLLLNLQSFCGLSSVIFYVSPKSVAFDMFCVRNLIRNLCNNLPRFFFWPIHPLYYVRAEFCWICNVVGVLQKGNLCNKWWMKLSVMSLTLKVRFSMYSFYKLSDFCHWLTTFFGKQRSNYGCLLQMQGTKILIWYILYLIFLINF